MAKKKSSGIKKWFDDHIALSIVLAVATVIVSFVGYNLFLDWRNRVDIRDLLTSLEQLEKELEAETGEEFYIDADCGTGGEFLDTDYSCSILLNSREKRADFSNLVEKTLVESKSPYESNSCRLASDIYLLTEEDADFYECIIDVRSMNESFSNNLFSNI